MKMLNSIKNKIMLSYTIIIILTVLVLESFFLLYVNNYYYSSAQTFLYNKAKITYNYYNKYMIYDDFKNKIYSICNNDIIKDDKVKFQIIDKDYNVITDSYGFRNYSQKKSIDIESGLSGTMQITKLKESGENIMAVSVPIKRYNHIDGIVRYVISLEKIQRAVIGIQIFALLCGLLAIIIVFVVSLILSRSIVNPISNLKLAANEIAKGNFKIRPQKLYDDEIGELTQTFCYMANEIDKSQQIKNEFISSISHELRTPLTSIKGWSETLSYGADKEELDLGLNIINSETNRLINLVEELLDFSKFESNAIKMNFEVVDIKQLIESIIAQFKLKMKEKNIDLKLCVDLKDAFIVGDADRLKQVFINLIYNSFKFTSENGYILVKINDNESECVTISIEDNGIGISKENISKVTDKFFQENHKKSGSGIGLSISNEIIQLHNGKLLIESEKDKGTKITITLRRGAI